MTISQMELLTDLGLKSVSDNLKHAFMALREGRVILLLDAHERENEGDLIVAAEKITSESMNFLIKQGSGVVCLALPKKRLDHLGLPLMIPDNTNVFQTAFTVSIEASSGVTTGVSAKDRAHTITVAMKDDAKTTDLARPGHVFPLAACANGVFERMGHTEGSVDLMRMAGLKAGAVLCELMNEDGSMAVGHERINFAQRFNIPVVSIEEIFCHRMRCEDIVKKSTKSIATRFGQFMWHNFKFSIGTAVDVFHKQEWLIDTNRPTRLSVAAGDNLSARFMAQILTHSEDDPMVNAFMDVKNAKGDLAIMVTDDNTSSVKTKGEMALRKNAAIARALVELSVNQIHASTISDEQSRIAGSYFAIDMV